MAPTRLTEKQTLALQQLATGPEIWPRYNKTIAKLIATGFARTARDQTRCLRDTRYIITDAGRDYLREYSKRQP